MIAIDDIVQNQEPKRGFKYYAIIKILKVAVPAAIKVLEALNKDGRYDKVLVALKKLKDLLEKI
jgi:hypothetical protein